tara:strand:+ start:1141 stop:1395 length:255 start_codon:yes stop_codon:yes gene_type:complete
MDKQFNNDKLMKGQLFVKMIDSVSKKLLEERIRNQFVAISELIEVITLRLLEFDERIKLLEQKDNSDSFNHNNEKKTKPKISIK